MSVESIIARSAALGPPVNFSGKWRNELGSDMELTAGANNVVSGKYRTNVGNPKPTEEFNLTGFGAGDLIAFSVDFSKYGSLTSWAGQVTMKAGKEVIHTLWFLARNVKDPDEPADLWKAILAGSDDFERVT